jgi:hypothetical protein
MEILEVLILSVQLDNSVSGQYMADRRQVETMETFTSIAFLGLELCLIRCALGPLELA